MVSCGRRGWSIRLFRARVCVCVLLLFLCVFLPVKSPLNMMCRGRLGIKLQDKSLDTINVETCDHDHQVVARESTSKHIVDETLAQSRVNLSSRFATK